MHNRGVSAPSLYTRAGERKYVGPLERAKFIATARRWPRAAVGTLCLTLAYTGCRISEALAVTASAVEAEAGFIAIRCLKKRSRVPVIREVPIPPELVEALTHTHDLSDLDHAVRLWPFSRCRAWQLVKEVLAAAGIANTPYATPKGLRHGFGIHAIRCDIPLNLVQRWLGHARMETTALYLAAMGQEEREIAARMWTN
jgi:integrase